MSAETTNTAPVLLHRLIRALPLVGRIYREVTEGDDDNIWYLLLALVSLWGIAILTWGLPAFYLPMVAAAPVCLLLLVLLTLG